MSFFPLYSADRGFAPLFRLLDDFDSYSHEAQRHTGQGHNNRHHMRSFNPRFDVRETETAYELHGELPGIQREHINIEFTQPQTLSVRGRVERTYTTHTAPAGTSEDSPLAQENVVDAGENNSSSSASHHATVEDEADDDSTAHPTPAETPQSQAVTPADSSATKHDTRTAYPDKYWISERSVGDFSRSFNFPTRVDQDVVTANLNSGVLTIVVPKAKKHESRRISVN